MKVPPMKNTWFLALLVFLCGCEVRLGYYEKDRQAAEAAVDIFHQFWTEGRFSEMYGLTGEALRRNQTEQQFVQAAEQTMLAFGATKESRQLRAACSPNQVRLLYQTNFRNGKGTERITWEIHGDKAELIGYEIVPGEVDVETLPDSSCSK